MYFTKRKTFPKLRDYKIIHYSKTEKKREKKKGKRKRKREYNYDAPISTPSPNRRYNFKWTHGCTPKNNYVPTRGFSAPTSDSSDLFSWFFLFFFWRVGSYNIYQLFCLIPLATRFEEGSVFPLSYSNKQFTRPIANIWLRPQVLRQISHHANVYHFHWQIIELKLTQICTGSNKLMLDFTSPEGQIFTSSEWVSSCREGIRGGSSWQRTS